MNKLSFGNILELLLVVLTSILLICVFLLKTEVKNMGQQMEEVILRASNAETFSQGADLKAGEASAYAASCAADVAEVKELLGE